MVKNNISNHLCKEVIIFLGLFFLPSLLAGNAGTVDPAHFSRWESLWSTLSYTLPRTAFLLFYLGKQSSNNIRRFAGSIPKLSHLMGGTAMALTMVAAISLLSSLSALLPETTQQYLAENSFRWEMNNPVLFIPLLITALSIGAWEELFFRSYLLIRFRQLGLGPWPALVLGALLFAAGHFYEGPAAVAMIFGLGLFLGFIFLKYRSWAMNSLAHGLYNFLILLLIFLKTS